jgi:hypothetical protein
VALGTNRPGHTSLNRCSRHPAVLQNGSKMFAHGASTAAAPMPRHDATRDGLRMSKGRAEGDRPVMLILPGRRVYTGPIRAAGPGIRSRAAPAGAMNEPTTNACRLGAIPVPIRSAGESRTVAVHMARV